MNDVREQAEVPVRVLNLFTIMDRGGAETMVMNYYREIDRSKVQFDFLVHRDRPGVYEQEIKELGGKIFRMPPIRPGRFIRYYYQMRLFFRAHPEYTIIHAHMSELACLAFFAAYKEGVNVRICHAHNAPHGWDYKIPIKNIFKVAMRPYITHMFSCGIEAGNWLYGKNNQDRFIYMHNAINVSSYRYNPEKRESLQQKLGLIDKLVIGHVGRFTKQKNHTFLLEIMHSLVIINPDTILLLVGEGPLENVLREQVKEKGLSEHVRFMGLREDVNDLLQVMDVFLMPSLYEGVSVALLEAQTSGLLCIVSAEQPKEVIITDQVYRLSLQRSPAKWAEYILKKSRSYQRKDSVGAVNDAGYDIMSNVKKLESFYLEVQNSKING